MSKVEQVVNNVNASVKHLTESFQNLTSSDHENEYRDGSDGRIVIVTSQTKPTLSSEIAPIHAISLASNLYKLYKDGVATDINVVCQEHTYQLHSTVLIHGSQYFRRVLLNKEKAKIDDDDDDDDDNNQVNHNQRPATFNLEFNPPIEPSTFEIVLESLYTGMVRNMTQDNITSLLEAYYHLDIEYAYDACVQFMLRRLDMDNCLTYWLAGKFCHSAQVQDKAIGLMGRHLKSFYMTTELLELQSFTIIEILQQDTLQVPNETIVFEAAMAWIKYDEQSRAIEISNLLDVVRMTYLPAFYLVNVVGKEDLIENDRNAMAKYSKALKLKLADRHSEHVTPRHHSIHGVRGGLEKMKKQIENSNCLENGVEDWKGKIESMKARRREQVAAAVARRSERVSELEFEEDEVDNTHTRSLLEPEPIDQLQEEEEVKEKPTNFIGTFLDKLKKKKTNAIESVNDETSEVSLDILDDDNNNNDDDVKEEEPKSDDFEENQFSISYQRLKSLPEENEEDLSEETSTKCESKTGLSYSNEDVTKKTSDDDLIQLEIEPDIVRSIVNGPQNSSDQGDEYQDDKVEEGDLINFELPQDMGANQKNHLNDDDSFDF